MKFLLDTCTFVWLVAEPKRLSGRVAQALEEELTIATPDPAIKRYPVPVVW